jgi:hypothetical protein
LLYETLSLITQTSVLFYFMFFVWRHRITYPHSCIGFGMMLLVARQIVEVHEHASRGYSDPNDLIECLAFALLMLGLYAYHTRERAERVVVAQRIRDAVEGSR